MIIFVALVSLNYICQTTFVPHLLSENNIAADHLIQSFTMSNPNSLSWGLEMCGYAILGLSLWFLRTYYQSHFLIRFLIWANAILSLVSLVYSIYDAAWVETKTGLILYFIWNALMMMILVMIILYNKELSFNEDDGSRGI